MKLRDKEEQFDEISGKKFQERVFLRMLPYLSPHVPAITISVLLVFLSASIALYTPKLLGRMVDEALLPKDYQKLYLFCFLYAGLEIFRLLSMLTQSYYLQKVGQRVMHAIRSDLFEKLIRMPVPFFDHNPVGRLVTRVTNDVTNLAELFSAGFVMLISDIILIVGVIASVLALHWKLGLIGLSVFPLMMIAMWLFSGKLRRAFRGSRKILAQLNAFFAERVAGMPIVQLMGRERHEKDSYQILSTEYRERQFDGVYLYSLFHPIITVLSASSAVLVILFGPRYIAAGEIPLGTFVAFLAYMQVLYQPVRNITDKYNIFLAAMSSAERIYTLLDMKEEEGLREVTPSTRSRTTIQGGLEFKNVSFYYERFEEKAGEKRASQALKDVSFKIRPGETVAIVGHTGAGKSTLTSLLFRFYDPQEGSITLDGKDLRNYPKRELRERIGFVQQDVFLFSGTIRENLTLLRRDISEQEIAHAIQLSGFDKVMEKLPRGLDTLLDERGANLSLGERQILAFTRVFLQKPDLLVLDEATSSVDRESEIRIHAATKKLIAGRTSLIIAHRLSTIQDADRIFVFERGALKESGSHQELLARNETYHHLLFPQIR